MAEEYKITVPAHPSIYDPRERELDIRFSVPQTGVNNETGMLLLIPGFEGNPDSNIYKKMRNLFADEYNLITVQCSYFGSEFMQVSSEFKLDLKSISQSDVRKYTLDGEFKADEFLSANKHHPRIFSGFQKLNESLSNFNDMGIMQSLDNLTALLAVSIIVKDNGLQLNTGKIIAYGHSHGAYIAYLCNALAPSLFSMIIDNSAWLFPIYFHVYRMNQVKLEQITIDIRTEYLAASLAIDNQMLYLPTLYGMFVNQSRIVTFHGIEDILVDNDEKKKFVNSLPNSVFHLITPKDVDHVVFKSAKHGDADFLELFRKVMLAESSNWSVNSTLHMPNIQYHTSHASYFINYETGLPKLLYKPRRK